MKQPIGINLPIQHGKNGFFDQTFETNHNALVNLKIFFSTRPGERRLNVDFGTKLWNSIFENYEVESSIIEDLIRSEISDNFPNIILKSIDVKKDEASDIYGFQIIIKFNSNKYTSEIQTLTLNPQ